MLHSGCCLQFDCCGHVCLLPSASEIHLGESIMVTKLSESKGVKWCFKQGGVFCLVFFFTCQHAKTCSMKNPDFLLTMLRGDLKELQ